MKIAYITSDFGAVSETFITDLALGLAQAGHQVTVFCNQAVVSDVPSITIEQTNFLILNSTADRLGYRVDQWLGEPGQTRIYARHLAQAQRQLYPMLSDYGPQVAYIDYGSVAALARQTLCELNIPFVVHFHGADITSAVNHPAYRTELQAVFRDATTLIVASHHIRRLLILEGAPPEKVHVVRYGLNLEGLTPLSWSERRTEPPAIVFLGRFTPKKNPVALVQAFALVKQQVPQARFSMIGDGSEMARVRQRIERLKLGQTVKLYGTLPRDQALPIVNRHWVYAQHSITAPNGDQEGFGISLTEAAALALPVVSTLHNGIPEQVIDGQTGFLVREFDFECMAERMIALLQRPELAEQVGQAGRKNVLKLCQQEQRIKDIEQALNTCCAHLQV
ncbi:MAG: glycosyltransferase [Anaerolineales bacterium]|nr:glycosyltransferase [Anaerolineales bacterium]